MVSSTFITYIYNILYLASLFTVVGIIMMSSLLVNIIVVSFYCYKHRKCHSKLFHFISSCQWTLIKLGTSSDGQAPVEVNYEMISIHQTVTGSQNISTDPITTNQCPAYDVVSHHN